MGILVFIGGAIVVLFCIKWWIGAGISAGKTIGSIIEENDNEVRRIFYCKNCNQVFGGMPGSKEKCTECGRELFETSIFQAAWRNADKEKRKKWKEGFIDGSLLK